jgi:tripartite-type tricarboxylate transporter receptor subunit TctC
MMRSSVCRLLAASLALICTTLSGHTEYPDRPLKIIVAWPPGGVVDTTARVIGEQLSVQLR